MTEKSGSGTERSAALPETLEKRGNPLRGRIDIWWTIVIIATLLRLWMGLNAAYWFDSYGMHDDVLFLNYCNPFTHNHLGSITPYPNMRIVKETSFSLLLGFVYLSGLTYGFMTTALYVAAAGLTFKTVSCFTRNKGFRLFSYLYVLFYPSAFDQLIGTRVYRNTILIPCILITFNLLVLSALQVLCKSKRELLRTNIALAILFPYTCYIKEDGIWLLAVVAAGTLFEMMYLFYDAVKNRVRNVRSVLVLLLLVCMPVGGFYTYKTAIELFHLKFYGIALTNSRTAGELSDFVNLIYKIESPDRTTEVWAPKDAIDKAFEASETFQEHWDIYNNTIHTPKWFGDIEDNPIPGDFLTWVLRDGVQADKLWTSEKRVQDIFKQINQELREAFRTGRLKADKKFRLVPSMGGKNLAEIAALFPDMLTIYNTFLSLQYYNFNTPSSIPMSETVEAAEKTLHFPLHSRTTIQYMIGKAASVYSLAYIGINWVLFLLSLLILIYNCVRILTGKSDRVTRFVTFVCLFLLGTSVAYACAISWFCSFLTPDRPFLLQFYGCGITAFLIITCFLPLASGQSAVCVLRDAVRQRGKGRK